VCPVPTGSLSDWRMQCKSILKSINQSLAIVGPRIIIYFYSKTNQMNNISNLFYFGIFRTVSASIIRSLRLYIHHQVYVIQVLWLLASKQLPATEPVWHIPDAVCTVLDSWWWTERPSETCKALFQNKINLIYCAYGWFYYRINHSVTLCITCFVISHESQICLARISVILNTQSNKHIRSSTGNGSKHTTVARNHSIKLMCTS